MIQNGTKWLNRSTPTHKKQDTRVYGTEIPVLLIRHRILHIRPVIGFIILSYSSLENLHIFLGRICSGRYDKDLHTVFWTSPNPQPPPPPQPPKPQHQKNTSIHFCKDNWILGKGIVQAALSI